MKKTNLLAALSLLLLFSTGCEWKGIRGNGDIKTEQRPVSSFTRVDAGGFYDLEWEPGAPACSVTTDENLLSHVTTKMEGDILKIELRDTIAPTHGIKIAISSPSLAGASLRGALRFDATQLKGPTFALETSGASKVNLSGKVNRLLASLTGASKLHATDLAADDVELSVTGAGKGEVNASNLLRAAITGAGKVSYSGHPKSVEKKITGAGRIEASD
ncbi:MAG TPA: head GIN domain-containing protein [Chthoniobacterales bacterium]